MCVSRTASPQVGHVVGFVHHRRNRPLAATTIGASGLAPWAARSPLGRAFRERRRLSGTSAPRRLQLVFQPRVLAFQSRTLPFDTRLLGLQSLNVLTQPRILSSEIFDRLPVGVIGAPAHAPVMPEFPFQYKSDAVTKYQFTNVR